MPELAYQPVPLVAEVKMTYRQGTNLMSNVYHVAQDTEWTQANLVELCDEFYDWENTDAKGDRSIEIELVYITAAALHAPDGAYNAKAIDPAVGGLQPGDAMPLNVTLAITAITGTRGRGTQGRTFYIGLAESNVERNIVTNVTLDNIMDDYAALLLKINTHAGWQLVVVHRYKNNVRLVEGTFSPIVVFGVRDTTVDTQKNRLPNHRRASSRSLEDLCAEVIRRGGSCSVLVVTP